MTVCWRVIIAEDDEFIQDLLAAYFEDRGFQIWRAGSGQELLATLDSESPDLILLDLGLPDEDGLVLMRQIRARSTIPIVVLTGRKGREDRISALEMGADDYLTKPCDPQELVLRVQNLLARGSAQAGTVDHSPATCVSFADWTMDTSARSLTDANGNEVHLSRSEFNLLAALVKAANRVLNRSQLLDAISQHDSAPSERIIDVLVARLRQKLEADPRLPTIITTMVGVGYKFSATITYNRNA